MDDPEQGFRVLLVGFFKDEDITDAIREVAMERC